MNSRKPVVFLMAAALLTIPASAQAPGAVTLYSQTNFRGLSLTVTERRDNLTVIWPVRSVRVGRGPGWRLCIQTNLRNCTNFTDHRSNVTLVVRSAEPIPEPPPRPQPGFGTSLRGMASEFFPAPTETRGRVESCASGAAACARDSADRFCRSRGWTRSAHNLQETVNRQNFLADVLCVRAN